jgi:hypothetical protein
MTSLAIRRLIVLAVSTVLGILMSLLFQYIILPAVSPNPNEAPIAIARYGAQYFFWTAFPFTMIFVTLFDGFMDTRIWPD